MRVTVSINQEVIEQLRVKVYESAMRTAEELHADLVNSHTMPKNTGDLERGNAVVPIEYSKKRVAVALTNSLPYARRLHYHPEYNFSTAKNPNAGGEWLKPYLPGGEKENFVPDTFKEIMSGGGK